MKRLIGILSIVLFSSFIVHAQVDIGYQIPPKEILDLVDAPPPPTVMINDKSEKIVLMYRNRFVSIAELSEPELKLAGLRINPITNMPSRNNYVNRLSVLTVGEKVEKQISGLPVNPLLSNFLWSPDQSRIAFTHTTASGAELWILNVTDLTCKKLTGPVINGNIGRPFYWFPDSKNLIVKFISKNRKPLIEKSVNVPSVPLVSVSEGVKAQNRTYQDLLKDKADEFNFEQLALSEIYKIDLNGKKLIWKNADMYSRINFSPDGEYVLISTIRKPFSYLVPMDRFPSKTVICDKTGKEVKTIRESPLIEDIPQGFMAVEKGMRNISWRSDKPASLYYVEALDEGDPAKKAEFRDEVFQLNAPFNDEPKSILKTVQRFSGIVWGTDEIAVASDTWWNTRNLKMFLFNPSNPQIKPKLLFDINTQDNYGNPGRFVTSKNKYGENILVIDNSNLYLTGQGYSPEGTRAFFREFDLTTKKITEIWRADGKNNLEQITEVLDAKTGLLLTRVESVKEFPNYFIRNTKNPIPPKQITFFENPYKSLGNVYKEVISYKRKDGITLSGTLYLPAGYDRNNKVKLPLIMWAYPVEFKDATNAGQNTTSPHSFTSPNYGSPVFWVTRGYAILDNASFPIVGEGKNEPNDTFVEQLVENAKAAIDAVENLGYIDRKKVAVGGHSYGAFMTANLLTHSNLFAAGIARSGAYNRTLTPFGFQSEERNYWESPNVYNTMSPFMNAEKMKSPLLLVHGEADNNSGTFPLQSERYFNALKGLGANVRLVILPKESHGYSARESVLHLLWEQDQWLEKWVKNKK